MRLSPRLSLRSKAVQAVATLVSLTAVGCTADVISSAPTESPEERAAKEKFAADVQPILDGFCGACHVAQANIDFMKADPDVRTQVVTEARTLIADAARRRVEIERACSFEEMED